MPVPVFHATVREGGRVDFVQAEARMRRSYLARLVGKAVDVTVREHRDRRSTEQNAWWWGWRFR